MKIFSVVLFVSATLQAGQTLSPHFPQMADEQYAIDMKSTLAQFSGFTQPGVLRSYEIFMIMIKHYVDLGFRLQVMERKMTSTQRALLRTPMQNYNTCRTSVNATRRIPFSYPSYIGEELTVCDRNYAIETQKIYNSLISATESDTLQDYLNFMIMLKQYEDLSYRITNFEKITPLTVIAKLREPLKRYENSIDALIRVSDR